MRNASLNAIQQMLSSSSLALPIAGDCMVPVLLRGERVLIEPARFYWPGDIVISRQGQTLVAHRFLGWIPPMGDSSRRAIFKADRARRPDAPVQALHCLGRVQAKISARARLRAGLDFCHYLVNGTRQRLLPSPSPTRSGGVKDSTLLEFVSFADEKL